MFPDFDSTLREAFRREIGAVLRQHRPRGPQHPRSADGRLHVRQRAARQALRHSRMSTAASSAACTLGPELDMRRGLLGKGALLTVTSQAARTSPVTRGKWFLQTFLGISPPDPPPNVPAIKEPAQDAAGNTKEPTMRQRMEQHRSESGLRDVPQHLRAARPGARELRRRRDVAHRGRRDADRSDGQVRRRHDGRRPGEPARAADEVFRISTCGTSRRSC